MSREWVHRYAEGEMRMACSICGWPWRFPDEISRCSDGLFRCHAKCMETPVQETDKIIAESRRRREMPPPPFTFGVKPSWDPP